MMIPDRESVFDAEALARAVGHEEFKQVHQLILAMLEDCYTRSMKSPNEIMLARVVGRIEFARELLGRLGLAETMAKDMRNRYEELQDRERRRRERGERRGAPPRRAEYVRDGAMTT